MSGEFGLSSPEISMEQLQFAGALQAVLKDAPNRGLELTEEQEEAFQKIGSKILDGETAGYLECFTSFGKSLLISLATEAAVNAGQRVHIMAPTVTIANQLYGADGTTGLGCFTSLLDKPGLVRQNFGGKHGNKKAQVIISTYSGMLEEQKAIEEGKGKLGTFGKLLCDECHDSLGTQTVRGLYHYQPEATRLGFSATPDYADDRKSSEVFKKKWFEYGLRKAADNGKTAPMRALVMTTDSEIDLTDGGHNFTEKELAPLRGDAKRNGLALKLAQDFVAEGRHGFISCIAGDNNQHAVDIANILSTLKVEVVKKVGPQGIVEVTERNIVAKSVGAHITKDEQDKILREYKEGKIDVITFTKVLEQGWDTNVADFGINLQPSTSRRRILQLLGRLTRKKPDGRDSIFIDFLDKQKGINKKQYTGVHALEEDKAPLDMNRVLGDGYITEGQVAVRRKCRPLSESLRPELLARLLTVQGKTIHEVFAAAYAKAVDPVAERWKKVLESKGMPEELPYNLMFSPRFLEKYRQALEERDKATQQQNIDDPVTDYGRFSDDEINELLAYFSERVEFGDSLQREANPDLHYLNPYWQSDAQAPETDPYYADPYYEGAVAISDEDEPPSYEAELMFDKVITGMAATALDAVLETLGESESKVIRFRTGFGTGEGPKTNDEVGTILGMSRERIRQIELKTLSKLRHPSRSRPLASFEEDNPIYDMPETHTDTPSQGSILAGEILLMAPLHDKKDSRPHRDRLQTSAIKAARAWLADEARRDLGLMYEPDRLGALLTKQYAMVTAELHAIAYSRSQGATFPTQTRQAAYLNPVRRANASTFALSVYANTLLRFRDDFKDGIYAYRQKHGA
jgi:superfamily II DNA or RNA helicase